MSGVGWSIAFAVTASVSFGIGMALEHRGANKAPSRTNAHPGLLFDLLRSGHWRLGLLITMAGYGLQALAFATGRIVMIEPIMTLALVIALAAGGIINHQPLTRRQWLTAAATTAAVLVFTSTTAPAAGRESAPLATWEPWMIGIGAGAAMVLLISSHWRPRWRAGSLALLAGCTYGLTDALTKTVTDGLGHQALGLFTTWFPYALFGFGAMAFATQQTAYHASRLADAQPALSVTEPVVGSLIGITVLREHVHLHTSTDIVDGIAVVVMLVGIVLLGRLSDREVVDDAGTTPVPEPPAGGTAAGGTALAEAAAALREQVRREGPVAHRTPTTPGQPSG